MADLIVQSGDTDTVPSGDTERYETADIDGQLTVNGRLKIRGEAGTGTGTPDRPHVWQQIAAYAGAAYVTGQWLFRRLHQRWRHILAALVSAVLWVYTAIAATRVLAPTGGGAGRFGAGGLAWVAAFMAVLSVLGLILGLWLWGRERLADASAELPDSMQPGRATERQRGDD